MNAGALLPRLDISTAAQRVSDEELQGRTAMGIHSARRDGRSRVILRNGSVLADWVKVSRIAFRPQPACRSSSAWPTTLPASKRLEHAESTLRQRRQGLSSMPHAGRV